MFSVYHNSSEQVYKSVFFKEHHVTNTLHPSKIKGWNKSYAKASEKERKNNLLTKKNLEMYKLQAVLVSHNSELQKIKFGTLISTSGKAKRQANCFINILILLLAMMIYDNFL